MQSMCNSCTAGQEDDDFDIQYDEDGNPIAPDKPRYIDPLPAINHNDIDYDAFERCFYAEHPDIATLSNIQVQNVFTHVIDARHEWSHLKLASLLQVIDLQHKLNVRVSGFSPPKPVTSFGHFGFDEPLLKAIRKSEFTQPTPIQVTNDMSTLTVRSAFE